MYMSDSARLYSSADSFLSITAFDEFKLSHVIALFRVDELSLMLDCRESEIEQSRARISNMKSD